MRQEDSYLSIDTKLGGDGEDRRIDLNSDVIVSSWETTGYQVFTTEEDISGAAAYIVSVQGEVNENFFTNDNGVVNVAAIEQLKQGIPPFLYEIVEEDNSIIFEIPLFGDIIDFLVPSFYDPILDFKNNPNVGNNEQVGDRLQAAFNRILALRNGTRIRDAIDAERPFLSEPSNFPKAFGN